MIEEGAGCAQSIGAHLRDGIEAALRADPEVLANCKPRTGLGSFVRGLVLEACKGRVTAMKMLMGFLTWREPANEDFQLLQGMFFEPAWDWNPSGVWLTLPQTEAEAATNRPPNSLSQGISQGILEKPNGRIDGVSVPRPKAAAKKPATVGPEAATAGETEPLNRRHRRKLAWMMRQAEKEDTRIGHIAHTAMRSANFAQAGAVA